MRMLTIAIPLALAALVACGGSRTQLGRGATLDDRLVYRGKRTTYIFGLFGSTKVKTSGLCPNGDMMVHRHRTFMDFVKGFGFGILYRPSSVEVYCRDDALRNRRIAARRARQRVANADWERRKAAFFTKKPQWRSVSVRSSVHNPPRPTARTAPPPVRRRVVQPPPSPRRRVTRSPQRHQRRSSSRRPPTRVSYKRTQVRTWKDVAKTAAKCVALFPQDPKVHILNRQAHARMVRQPCERCVASGKSFYIYRRKPHLESQCR